MVVNGVKALAGVVLSGLAVGLPVGLLTGGRGTPILTTRSSNGQRGLGFQIAKNNSRDGVGKIGLKVGEKVKFDDSLGIKFGEYTLKKGDKLCSPFQDSNFFLMRKKGQGYEVEGQRGIQLRCQSYSSMPKTVQLDGLRDSNNMATGSTSVSSIELSTCSFKLEKTSQDKHRVIISDCWTYRDNKGTKITEASWEVS